MRSLGLIPVVVLALSVLLLAVFNLSGPVYNDNYLSLALQLIFVLGTNTVVAFVSARAYLQYGSPNVLLLGFALLVSGVATTVSLWTLTPTISPGLTPNEAVSIGNLGILTASFVLLLSGVITLYGVRPNSPNRRKAYLVIAFLAGLLLVLVISLLADFDLMPSFLSSNGPTELRVIVLTSSATFIFISCLLFGLKSRQSGSTTLYWNALALALFGIALIASVLTIHLGEAMNWASRISLYLSGIYFFVAIQSREARHEADVGVTERWATAFRSDPGQVADLFSNMIDGFAYCEVVTDAEGRVIDFTYLDVNRAFERMNGVRRDEVLGRRATEVFPSIRGNHDFSPYGRVAFRGESLTYERYAPPPVDKWYHFTLYCPQKGYFVALSEDITERKKAEQEVIEQKNTVERYLDIVGSLVLVLDSEGRVVLLNRKGYEIMGYEEGELVGKNWFETCLPPKERTEVGSLFHAWMQGEIDTPEHYENHVLTKNGEQRMISWHNSVIKGEAGRLTGTLSAGEDITERKKAEEELKRSNAELQQFAYVASHDMQEPLRMITSYMDLLERKYSGELNPKAQEYIHFAVDGAQRMRELVNDLLAYSRVESSTRPYSQVDMNEVAGKAMENLGGLIKENEAKVTIEPLPTVWGDKAQLTQVLQNLISNAIKFHSSELPRVNISVEQSNEAWVIAVKDNGIGISPENQIQLFKMFTRLHTHEEYPGTGIGLAIARKIVERHGGRIWVESEEGMGSTFFFSIPA